MARLALQRCMIFKHEGRNVTELTTTRSTAPLLLPYLPHLNQPIKNSQQPEPYDICMHQDISAGQQLFSPLNRRGNNLLQTDILDSKPLISCNCAGVAHLTAVVFCAWRISYLRKSRTGTKYRFGGFNRFLKLVSVLIALACLLIVLFQFNARLAADPNPLLDGKIAPFEWAREFPWLERLTYGSWKLPVRA